MTDNQRAIYIVDEPLVSTCAEQRFFRLSLFDLRHPFYVWTGAMLTKLGLSQDEHSPLRDRDVTLSRSCEKW